MTSKLLIILLPFIMKGTDSAMTDGEVKAAFMKHAMVCLKDHPLEMSDVMKLKSLELPSNPEAKCLLACAYRRVGTLNDSGKFDLEQSYKVAERTKEGDEKAITNGKKLADICIKVNDEPVKDGAKGCEVSGHMFKCVIENAPKLGFTV